MDSGCFLNMENEKNCKCKLCTVHREVLYLTGSLPEASQDRLLEIIGHMDQEYEDVEWKYCDLRKYTDHLLKTNKDHSASNKIKPKTNYERKLRRNARSPC